MTQTIPAKKNFFNQNVDLMNGPIFKSLFIFMLPIFVSNLFQQLYNMVDTWVVGNYVSNEAFSAVGTVTPIINTLIGFFLGLSSGAGVVISQYYGAQREEKVKQAVHTSLLLTLLLGVVFTVVGIVMKFFQIVISIVVGMAAGCIPIVGYNMGDYWQHWLDMGKKLPNAPKIFNVNWFRTDDEGNFEWPGFGDNLRVVEWILGRCFGEKDAVETELGYEPKPEDINLEGVDVTLDTVKDILGVDKELWLEECKGIREYYAQFGDKLPKKLAQELDDLEARLKK